MLRDFAAACAVRPPAPPDRRVRVLADDGTDLIAGVLEPRGGPVQSVLIFFHGAGAHMSAGYLDLCASIRDSGPCAALVPDLRGHGRSGGARGKAAHPACLWRDVDRWVETARARYPGATVHVGGHSLGAGLALNWLTRHGPARRDRVDSLILLAPYTGRAEIDAVQDAMQARFVQHSKEHASGDEARVRFDYAPEAAAAAGLLTSVSAALFAALAPEDWYAQLGQAAAQVDVIAARDDELFACLPMCEGVDRLARGSLRASEVEGGHLTCLHRAGPAIAAVIEATISSIHSREAN
ncbi:MULTISPECIES: alpha/beta hydrolase [unclassified Paraburkholderia]|uniref:alpha/beta hydrolase n=1 Tax=unclassified Paraburkholderia TaxID=2615204 RepID=UPI002AB0A176|nr:MULTISPECIES: alpha/beta fold hydrolase [unclassified Paraburkholderia]